ncbi:family 43 glycosylhydrolase [Micromonospora parva]|uniref:family 43 glycosylhydrolase n=1 Tax=Micromonospora parva TaxID=1464048 RepID=UPI003659F23B
MVIERAAGKRRRGLAAIGLALLVGIGVGQLAPIVPASAEKPVPPAPPGVGPQTPSAKVPLAGVDMAQTYVNPINLPGMAVRNIVGTMPPTDANVANTSQIPASLNLETWTAASGRTLASRSTVGFSRISENSARTGADWSALNVDGTIYLYASGAMQNAPNNNRTVWSTTDYLTWTPHQMNLGLVAPTVVQLGDTFYMAGNNTPVYQADSPTGPWTSMGNFLRPNGQTLSVGDVQFFPDTDGRLYLTYNIGSPIMGAELDPNNPRQLISDPVVLWTFDPRQEWQHIGDNKATYTHGYVEGSQLFKVGDTYYLSVASGGTEFTTYATGVMTSNKPLSGFKVTQQNPIGYGNNHPSAVYPNAGHGSFVLDNSGNLVFFYTYVIAYEEFFERRLGMDVCTVIPAGPKRGAIDCELSNTPQLAPGKKISGRDDVGLYNVATNSQAYWASSYAPGRNPYYGGDRSLSTWWEPADSDTAPTYIRGFGTVFHISAAQIQWKELGRTFTADNAVRYTLEYKDIPTNTWRPLVDRSTNTTAYTADYVTFDRVLTNAVRLKVLGTTENVKVGVHELNVFGENYNLVVSKGMITP